MAATYSNLLYHIVFSTKERRGLITAAIEPELYAYIGGIVRNNDGKLLEIGGIKDHIHLLLKLPPKLAVSDVIRDVKANSSKWLNEEKSKFRSFSWQDRFAAFSVSESQVGRVRAYIRRQKEHHRRQDFKTELVTLLRKNRIEFDERYLWG